MDEIVESYRQAVNSLALASERQSVCDLRSGRDPNTRVWTLRDKGGVLIAEVGKRAEPVQQPARTKASPKYVTLETLQAVVVVISDEFKKRFRTASDSQKDLVERLEKLEAKTVSKSLDAEAFVSLEEMAERLDRLESALQDIAHNGLRYRGYWKSGMRAKRGDAFTHDGSLWWACRDADDMPSRESPNWNIAIRKGRDAK